MTSTDVKSLWRRFAQKFEKKILKQNYPKRYFLKESNPDIVELQGSKKIAEQSYQNAKKFP